MLLCSGDDDRACSMPLHSSRCPGRMSRSGRILLSEWVEIAYRLDVNEYRGRRSLQLIVEQIEKLQLGQQVRLG